MREEITALARYRLQEAYESLEEADILLKEKKTRGAMNRVYYSMFYAALALLATKQLEASKHSGVISLFHKEFVKHQIFPKDIAKFLDVAFDLRNKCDYKDFVIIKEEHVEELLNEAKCFVERSGQLLDKLLETN
ncbi:hypothetical protein AUJ95_09440 [Candidatus Desantisbacteria bacterium CG2_30_40_21]|uniref:HEPN domain-containing protein n=5 Tax=unclassified Candidatus Desantisiibacteriota TaxID=3106372 RepID=A0A2M7JCP0_9BACT|nr:MAG: hypothetical protein AUJ95_09440 [Candidatus Desantisbacteria bacterium CG2_30_40_21]PIP39722.1 MAG: HEPN domain-containing protein [Candidatus Desantisbacteria bacterium CG23_combo_of_CG06-09_8_20_14_all_40_23]PIX17156.1 MAG: HEPN domain-containing protein [Candidatus Desantisbacteria bacterium CG_4_8_14_3_um_filter_40_12]PIY20113.1 MAG: HEPN domain-containing protein [Candidatus Desantisbacteria bacterium CG_4_10_14_3_um_filter_40_18]PJB28134.1 MAG: HEPN domain-containing protein [Can